MNVQSNAPDRYTTRFDETWDVVVIGYGFAGAAAAIAAHDAGAKVLLIEKMADPGGISICSGGGMRLAHDPEQAFQYLKAQAAGTTPDDILRTFCDGMMALEDYWKDLAKVSDAKLLWREREANYPLPGYKTFYFIEVDEVPGFDAERDYPHARARNGGPKIFKVLEDNIRQRGIAVRLSTPALRLITDGGNETRGVWIEQDGQRRAVKARNGVILACGGFENSDEMKKQFWQLKPVLYATGRGNTGDGIRMAQDLGAELWHMWHFHGSYGIRHHDPAYPFAIRMKRLPDWTPGSDPMDVPMSWILISKGGKRFMNECPPYAQDTSHRPIDHFEPIDQEYPYIPAFAVIDEAGRKMYPLAQTVFNDRDVPYYKWSDDNLQEVGNGMLKKAETPEALATLIGCDPATLQASLDRWNALCDAGEDTDFRRPPGSMTPLRTPPYYVAEVWPVVSNTQGGPRHDTRQRVLNSFGEPIPRLYEAGECGSIWGHLYMTGGNLSECFITGRISGAEVSALKPWDAA